MVPGLPIAAGIEPFPRGLAKVLEIDRDRAQVVELVGDRDAHDRFRLASQALQVGLLPRAPCRLRILEGVGQAVDEHLDHRTEPATDLIQRGLPALILRPVVEQRGDRLVLVAAVLERQAAHGEEMHDVRDRRSLAGLARVQLDGVAGRLGESVAEDRVR